VKIQVVSDIHQETLRHKPRLLTSNLDCDLLILAGDICSTPREMVYLPPELPVIHVMGNHEYSGKDFKTGVKFFKENWASYGLNNVHTLEQEIYIKDNIRFLCCTMWTNFWTEDNKEHQGINCRQGMNDFYLIENMSISAWLQYHEQSVQWLKDSFKVPFEGKTVVVTHHAPSFKSNGAQHITSEIRAGFCTDLEYLITEEQPCLWIHGHTHVCSDYLIGKTRVVSNCLGYPGEPVGFNPNLTIEL